MRLFLLAAIACFVLALLLALGALSSALGAGYVPWALGGLLAWALDALLGAVAVGRRPPPA